MHTNPAEYAKSGNTADDGTETFVSYQDKRRAEADRELARDAANLEDLSESSVQTVALVERIKEKIDAHDETFDNPTMRRAVNEKIEALASTADLRREMAKILGMATLVMGAAWAASVGTELYEYAQNGIQLLDSPTLPLTLLSGLVISIGGLVSSLQQMAANKITWALGSAGLSNQNS